MQNSLQGGSGSSTSCFQNTVKSFESVGVILYYNSGNSNNVMRQIENNARHS